MPRILCLLLCLASAAVLPAQERAIADGLPPDTLLHLEVPGAADLMESLDSTDLLALFRNEEIRDFLRPALDGMRRDLETLMEDEEGLLELLLEEAPGRFTFSLLSVRLEEDEDVQVETAASLGLPGRAAAVVERLRAVLARRASAARRGEEGALEPFQAGGRTGFLWRTARGEKPLVVLADGDRLLAAFGEEVWPEFFDREGGLASNPDFQAVRAAVGADSRSIFVFADIAGLREIHARWVGRGSPGREDESEALERVLRGSPTYRAIRAAGYALRADGHLLSDRLFLFVPGDHSVFGDAGPVGDAPERHALLLPAGADALMTTWFDAGDYLRRSRAEWERVATIYRKQGLQEEWAGRSRSSLMAVLDSVAQGGGFNVETELVPALGHHLSAALSFPEGGGLTAFPDVMLVVDLADADAVTRVLDRLLDRDGRTPGLRVRASDFKNRRLVTLSLLNAALPILPTLCVVDGQLLVTLNPASMKALLSGLDGHEHLAGVEPFDAFLRALPREASMALWVDLGSTFEYLYGLTGILFSSLRMQGMQLGERFDPSLLPPGDLVALFLGAGSMWAEETPDGFLYSGRSALANPVTGLLGGGIATLGLLGGSEGLREAASEHRRERSRDNLIAIAAAMEAYKASVGSGAYPEDLMKLVDRGILSDPSRLVDPADPKPRRVRTGTGERLPLSYAIGRTESLPEKLRGRMGGVEFFLYTRGAWHDSLGRAGRMLYPLGGSGPGKWAHFVPAELWGR